jgi:hypothetical protein
VSRHWSNTHNPAKVRVYCPQCGEVRGSAQYTHPQTGNARVYAHRRTTGVGVQTDCPGGPVTLGEDSAT